MHLRSMVPVFCAFAVAASAPAWAFSRVVCEGPSDEPTTPFSLTLEKVRKKEGNIEVLRVSLHTDPKKHSINEILKSVPSEELPFGLYWMLEETSWEVKAVLCPLPTLPLNGSEEWHCDTRQIDSRLDVQWMIQTAQDYRRVVSSPVGGISLRSRQLGTSPEIELAITGIDGQLNSKSAFKFLRCSSF